MPDALNAMSSILQSPNWQTPVDPSQGPDTGAPPTIADLLASLVKSAQGAGQGAGQGAPTQPAPNQPAPTPPTPTAGMMGSFAGPQGIGVNDPRLSTNSPDLASLLTHKDVIPMIADLHKTVTKADKAAADAHQHKQAVEDQLNKFKPQQMNTKDMLLRMVPFALMALLGGKNAKEAAGYGAMTALNTRQSNIDKKNQQSYQLLQDQQRSAQWDVQEADAALDRQTREAELHDQAMERQRQFGVTQADRQWNNEKDLFDRIQRPAANATGDDWRTYYNMRNSALEQMAKVPGYEEWQGLITPKADIERKAKAVDQSISAGLAIKAKKDNTTQAQKFLGHAISEPDGTLRAGYFEQAYNSMNDDDPNKKVVKRMWDYAKANPTVRFSQWQVGLQTKGMEAARSNEESLARADEAEMARLSSDVKSGVKTAEEANIEFEQLRASREQHVANAQSYAEQIAGAGQQATGNQGAQGGDTGKGDTRPVLVNPKGLQGNIGVEPDPSATGKTNRYQDPKAAKDAAAPKIDKAKVSRLQKAVDDLEARIASGVTSAGLKIEEPAMEGFKKELEIRKQQLQKAKGEVPNALFNQDTMVPGFGKDWAKIRTYHDHVRAENAKKNPPTKPDAAGGHWVTLPGGGKMWVAK